MSALITLDKVMIGYGKKSMLGPIELSVERGEFWGILGPNGSGKSTLIKSVLGLIPLVSGEINTCCNINFGYVPQHAQFDTIYPLSVYEIVSMGRYSRIAIGKRLTKKDADLISGSLDKLGLVELRNRPFRSLSGGEKQRALLARAIVGEPDVLVLDEPTASIDIRGELEIMKLVQQIQTESNLAVLMVSHFMNTVATYADNVILIDKDKNIFQARAKNNIFNNNNMSAFFELNVNIEPGGRLNTNPRKIYGNNI